MNRTARALNAVGRTTLVLTLSAGTTAGALAAQSSISSDRPGFATGTAVIGDGTTQLEAGTSYAGNDAGNTLSIGEALVRIGFRGIELELFANSFIVTRSDVPGVTDREGLGDVGFGVKVPLARGVGDRADFSIQAILGAPTGSEAFTSDEWVPSLTALMDVALGERGALSTNLGFRPGPANLEDVVTVVITPALSLSEQVGVYAGWAGFFSDGGDNNIGEGGITFLPSPWVQLDLNGGWSLDTSDWFFGGGVAVHWGG